MKSSTQSPERQSRLVRALTVAALVLVVLASPGRAVADPAGDASVAVDMVNEIRVAYGRAPVTPDPELQALADQHAYDMAANGSIWHSGDVGSRLSWGWSAWGENVGYGPSIDWIHGALLRSPSHATNVLNWSYNYVGIGVAYGHDGTVYTAQVFGTW